MLDYLPFLSRPIAPFDFDHWRVMALMDQASARFVMPRFGALSEQDVSAKTSPTDLVTIADIESELWLSEQLVKLLPNALVLGEEAHSRDPQIMDYIHSDEPLWIIDPVDGTSNFTKSSDNFCMMLALCLQGRVLASWILAARHNAIYCAHQGYGAYKLDYDHQNSSVEIRDMATSGARMQILPQAAQEGFISLKYFPQSKRERLKENYLNFVGKNKTLGSAGIEYAAIASNAASHAIYRRLKPWDHVPGSLLVQEAGGTVLNFHKGAYCYTEQCHGLVASQSQQRAEQLIGALELEQIG